MSEKKEYSVSEFKAKALGLLDQVSRQQKTFTITKRGRPVAKVVPWEDGSTRPTPGRLSGTILEENDIISPLGADLWRSAK